MFLVSKKVYSVKQDTYSFIKWIEKKRFER